VKDVWELLEAKGLTREVLVSTALELYFPHPGVETREKAVEALERELELAFSDPNLCLLVYACLLLEEGGERGELPCLSPETFQRDLTCLIVDEVLGMTIAQYIGGYKAIFEYARFDKKKPGILASLGPFLDDMAAGIIGGISSNMYTRAHL